MGTDEDQALHRTNTVRPSGHASSVPGLSSPTNAAPLGSPLGSPPTHTHFSPLEADRTGPETSLPIDMVSRMGSLNLDLAIDPRADDPLDPWDPTLDVPPRPDDTLGSSLGQSSTHRSSIKATPLGSSLSHSSQVAVDHAIGSSIPVDQHAGEPTLARNNMGTSASQAPRSNGQLRDDPWAQPASSLGTSFSGAGQALGTSLSAHSNLSSGYSTSHLETPGTAAIWGSSALGGQEWGLAEGRHTSNDQPAASDPFGASVSSLSPVSPTMHKVSGPTQTAPAAPWHGSSWAPVSQASLTSSFPSSHANTADRWGSVGPIASSPTLKAAWPGSSAGTHHGYERVPRGPAPIGRKTSGDPSLSSYVDPLLTSTSPTKTTSVQLSRPEPSLMVGFSTPRLGRDTPDSSTPLGTRDSSSTAAPSSVAAPPNTLASPAPAVSGLSATRSRFMASSGSSGPGKKEVDADEIFLLE